MKRRFREPCLSWREERVAAAESGALGGRVFVGEAASETGGRVLNHAEETVGEFVEAEVDVASGLVVVVKATALRG